MYSRYNYFVAQKQILTTSMSLFILWNELREVERSNYTQTHKFTHEKLVGYYLFKSKLLVIVRSFCGLILRSVILLIIIITTLSFSSIY